MTLPSPTPSGSRFHGRSRDDLISRSLPNDFAEMMMTHTRQIARNSLRAAYVVPCYQSRLTSLSFLGHGLAAY